MSDSFEFTLHSPLTKEDWNIISDAELDNTDRIWFATPSSKRVDFIKADVLDKIRAEIEKAVWEDVIDSFDGTDEVRIPRLDPDDVFEIIGKYKAESEVEG